MIRCFFFHILLFGFIINYYSFAQDEVHNSTRSFFIEPEFMLGNVVKTKSIFPERDLRQAYFINVGFYNNSETGWSRYYNYPFTGFSFFYSDLGNDSIFGKELNVSTFIAYNLSRHKFNAWQIRLGLGLSYFTKHYNAENNIINDAVGSSFTWGFQAFLYRNIVLTPQLHLKIGGGFLHGSNGHTKLPNYGINSAMGSIALKYFTQSLSSSGNRRVKYDAGIKNYFINYRYGTGFHEFGGTSGPVGGPTDIVNSHALSVGIIFRRHIKVRTGFTFRYYHHFYSYITENNPPKYMDNPRWNASNIFFFIGCEFLLGHFGMDIEGGLNLHKPFYREFFVVYEEGSELSYQLKRWFPTRLGLNYYIINTNKMPKHNIFAGVNINANFGEADFTECSIGYTYQIK